MGTYALQMICDHEPGCKSGGPNVEDALLDIRNADKAKTTLRVMAGEIGQNVECPTCGCVYNLVVDGEDIAQEDVSCPRIDSLSVSAGSTTGGTTITVNGHRLDYGTVVVKIGGALATNIGNQVDGSLTCDTPAGDISFEQEGLCWCRCSISNVVGTFQVGETVSQAGKTRHPEVMQVDGWFYLKGGASSFDTGVQITGDISGATATFDEFHQVAPGETATGETSGAMAVLTSVANLKPRVHQVSGSFQGGEWAYSSVALTRIQLKATPLDAAADVTVENERGQRPVGGKLAGGFTYTS